MNEQCVKCNFMNKGMPDMVGIRYLFIVSQHGLIV